jgi:hypothetical protein
LKVEKQLSIKRLGLSGAGQEELSKAPRKYGHCVSKEQQRGQIPVSKRPNSRFKDMCYTHYLKPFKR